MSRELPDELDQDPVVGVSGRLKSEDCCRVTGDDVIVEEEVACCRIEIDEPGCVRRAVRIGEDGGVEGPPELVHRKDVVSTVADPRGCVGHRVEDLSDGGSDRIRDRSGSARTAGSPPVGKRQEVVALGVVELERRRQAVEDALGGAGEIAALHRSGWRRWMVLQSDLSRVLGMSQHIVRANH